MIMKNIGKKRKLNLKEELWWKTNRTILHLVPIKFLCGIILVRRYYYNDIIWFSSQGCGQLCSKNIVLMKIELTTMPFASICTTTKLTVHIGQVILVAMMVDLEVSFILSFNIQQVVNVLTSTTKIAERVSAKRYNVNFELTLCNNDNMSFNLRGCRQSCRKIIYNTISFVSCRVYWM